MDLSSCCTCNISKTSPLSNAKNICTPQEMRLQGGAEPDQHTSGQAWLQESLWHSRCLQVPTHTKICHVCHTPPCLGADLVEDGNQQLVLQELLQSNSHTDLVLDTEVSAPVCCAHITADTSSILMWKTPCVVHRYTGAAVPPKQIAMGVLLFPFKLNWNKLTVNLKLQ